MFKIELLEESAIDYVMRDGKNFDRYELIPLESNSSITKFCAKQDLRQRALLKGCEVVVDLYCSVSRGRKPENYEAIGVTPKYTASGTGLKLKFE